MEIKTCAYHEDRNTISILTMDGIQMSLPQSRIACKQILLAAQSWYGLKTMNRPPMQNFSSKARYRTFQTNILKATADQQEAIEKQLTGHFNGDKAYAAAIAREIMMYGV